MCVLVTPSCPILCDPMDCSLPMEFSRQKYWNGRVNISDFEASAVSVIASREEVTTGLGGNVSVIP